MIALLQRHIPQAFAEPILTPSFSLPLMDNNPFDQLLQTSVDVSPPSNSTTSAGISVTTRYFQPDVSNPCTVLEPLVATPIEATTPTHRYDEVYSMQAEVDRLQCREKEIRALIASYELELTQVSAGLRRKQFEMDRLLRSAAPTMATAQSRPIGDDPLQCQICNDAKKTRRLAPCGHMLCERCAKCMRECPFCRATVRAVDLVYF